MKKKLLISLLIGLSSACIMTACGQPSNTEKSATTYTVVFKDESGKTLHSAEVEEGKIPSYVYDKADTAEWDYTVIGWSTTQDGEILSSLPTVSADATYFAKVEQKKQVYTVKYVSAGEVIETTSLEYGAQLSELPTPERSGYNFVSWCTDENTENAVVLPATIIGNVTYYAKWNEKVDIGKYLSALLDNYELNPLAYIPETMTGTYSANLISPNQIVSDYTSNVNVSNMLVGGFGEQWNMVLDNLNQSMVFFNTLTVVEGLITTSVTAFNNYIDQNPSETARHSFQSGIYTVTVDFDGEEISYVLDYTANIPALGEQTIQIYLSMNIESAERQTRIQIGEPNALSYKITENSYEFAIKYLGVRRAFFSVSRDENGNCVGHIYEHLSYEEVGVHSAADFYITEDYVSVVGNKADAFIGFKGYIDEVYNVKTGKMLGYEIRETLSKITYNTLWFNLDQVSGINSIRYQKGSEEEAFYVNGSSTAWENMKVGGFSGKMLSRRFDIEFRTQYFYSYDNTTKEYVKHTVQVPMFFVQEENMKTLTEDIKETNNLTVTLNINNTDLTKIQADYDTYVDTFILNKDLVTEEVIIAYIGEKILFE